MYRFFSALGKNLFMKLMVKAQRVGVAEEDGVNRGRKIMYVRFRDNESDIILRFSWLP